jgi:D-alanine-D-alanine ligase
MSVVKLRTNVVVIFGGQSPEHDVSCTTAWHVTAAIDRTAYDVGLIGITRDGQWNVVSNPFEDELTDAVGAGRLSPEGSPTNPFEFLAQLKSASSEPIVVLPMLHGPLGEDGTIQGLLEVIDVPYVGSGVLGSAVAMDKSVAKIMIAAAGIPVPQHITLKSPSLTSLAQIGDRVANDIGFPCFVKPANMGSSIGVSRVDRPESLSEAITVASTFDSTILIEEAINGREIEVAVLGNDDAIAFPPGEVLPADAFYSYSDKYLDGNSTVEIPANIPQHVADEICQLAIKSFNALGCSGLARCDFFYEENGRGILFNEINTMPGFTPISMYPKMVMASGLSYSSLVDRLIELALERHSARVRNTRHSPT